MQLGTSTLNASHIGIRNQVSNIGLDGKFLTQIIGTYIRKCLLYSCREIQADMVRNISQDTLGFRANESQIEHVINAMNFKTEQTSRRSMELTFSLDESKLTKVERYLLFNEKTGTYKIEPKEKKFLRWNPIDGNHENRAYNLKNGGRYVFARKVNHPYYQSDNKLDKLFENSRHSIVMTRIFREHMPELVQDVKDALVDYLGGAK